ncbi:Tyrosine-protein phosphatase non-receptor type 23 [Bulinus truncatus]|nr:Tyrosine-protein phosphatase non-receptor type 23 [Bulinus truncatus]
MLVLSHTYTLRKQNTGYASVVFHFVARYASIVFHFEAGYASVVFHFEAGYASVVFHFEAGYTTGYASVVFHFEAGYVSVVFHFEAEYASVVFHFEPGYASVVFHFEAGYTTGYASVVFHFEARYASIVFHFEAGYASVVFHFEAGYVSVVFYFEAEYASVVFHFEAGYSSVVFHFEAGYTSVVFHFEAGYTSVVFHFEAGYASVVFHFEAGFGPWVVVWINLKFCSLLFSILIKTNELFLQRKAAIQVSRDVMGCTTLKKYYAQLLYLQGRFPMVEGGEAAIAFTWEDVQTGRDTVICDIKFEQACILYNIGSLHSLLGALDTRHNAEGMKVSCTHFQCAAWAFELLRNNFCSSSMSTDMSFELLNFHVTLMLAQAQECILEKSIFDNRKNSITAKVAAKEWSRRLIMKTTFYQSITFFFLGREAEDAEKPGDCLAYFTAAKDELNKATQLAKNEVPEVTDSLHFAKDVILGKYESAKKDNDFVYHAKVPAIDSLPEIKGASLVKGLPFDPNDKEISGPDIFQKLVPMEAHEASSVYSEEKAKLSRTVIGEVDQKNMELDQFMSSLQLDIEQLMPKPNIIPDNLMEKCAAMSVRTNAIKELTDSMTNVSGLATEVELSLEEIQQLIIDDIEKTEQMEKQYGKKNPSPVLQRLQEELETYRQQHKEGNQLNATLHKAMNTHTNNLKTLIL